MTDAGPAPTPPSTPDAPTTPRTPAPGAGRLGVGDPAEWEADVVLRDGTVAHVRPIHPDDKAAIARFHAGQSPESVYLRFFAAVKELSPRDLARFTEVDQVERVALVVTVRDEIIGIGRYDCTRDGAAEVAFNIADRHQGKGIGSVLLEHLAAIGHELGVQRFTADVLPQNRAMINVFRDAGYEVTHAFEDGVVALSFDIAPTTRSQQVRQAREHRAEARSLAAVLRPESVVVVGASTEPDSAGGAIVGRILDAGYQGDLHVVHPTATTVHGITVARSVRDVGPDDLAVVVVPARAVLDVVDDCAAAGVRALLVMSGGFAEAGERDAALQVELRRRAHAAGMRVVGPHSYGVATTAVGLNATPTSAPLPGALALFVQSGAIGVACLGSAARRGLGLSTFLSAGNRLDVSGNDLMQYALDDPDTRVVGLHLESVGNPRKFSRIARQLGATKPVVVVKAGQSGTAVPPGQLVRRSPVPPGAFEAMLRQAGVIEAATVHEMVDVAQLLAHQPLPAGPRVRVIGNTVGLEALTANVAVARGLVLAGEPLTLPMRATAQEVADACTQALADDDVDSLVVCYEPEPVGGQGAQVRAAVARAAADATKPVLMTLLGVRGIRHDLTAVGPDGQPRTVPAYSMPEDAVIALAAATRYAAWRARPDAGPHITCPDADRHAAFAVLDAAIAPPADAGAEGDGGRDLTPDELATLLAAYGVAPPASDASDADGPGDPDGAPGDGAGPGHRDVLLATRENPLFGPLIGFSLAGPVAELLADHAWRIPPLTPGDVDDLLHGIAAYPLVERADPSGGGRAALADVAGRLAALADDFPELAHLEATVRVEDGRARVVGVRGRAARPQVRSDADRRAMTL